MNDEIQKLVGLCALYGEDMDDDGDHSMDASSLLLLDETVGIITTTISTEELLDLSTEPPTEDLKSECRTRG